MLDLTKSYHLESKIAILVLPPYPCLPQAGLLSPPGDGVVMLKTMIVILSEAKNLKNSIPYKFEILRLTPQNDIATQPPGERGE
jgi:hypothetical protein